jgi:hypothetical protein
MIMYYKLNNLSLLMVFFIRTCDKVSVTKESVTRSNKIVREGWGREIVHNPLIICYMQ